MSEQRTEAATTWCDEDDMPAAICNGPHVAHTCPNGDRVVARHDDTDPCPGCGVRLDGGRGGPAVTANNAQDEGTVIDSVRRPCACSFDGGWPRFTADWHRRHREGHLAEFSDVDQITRDNLAMFIDMAESREAQS